MRHLINLDWADREQEHHLRELIRPLSTEQERKAQRAGQVRTPELDRPALTAPSGDVVAPASRGDRECEARAELDAQLELGGLGSSSRRTKSVLGTVRGIEAESHPSADASFASTPSMLEAGAGSIDPFQGSEPLVTQQAAPAPQSDGTPWLLAAMHRPWRSPAAVSPATDVATPVAVEPAPPVSEQPQIDGTPWLLAAMHRPWSSQVAVPAAIDAATPTAMDGAAPDRVGPDRAEPTVTATAASAPSVVMPDPETISFEDAGHGDEAVSADDRRTPATARVCVGVVPGPNAPSYARVLGYAGPAADELVRATLREFEGTLLRDRPGSFMVEFSDVVAALRFSMHVQGKLHGCGEGKHAVRIGVHSVCARSEEHAALAEALAVRISSAAGDDQIVVTSSAAADVPTSACLELHALPDSVVGEDGAPVALSRVVWR